MAASASLPADKIDQAAIASLSLSDAAKARVLTHLDLTQAFSTSSQWTLVVVQDDTVPPDDYGSGTGYEHGAMAVCLVKGLDPTCEQKVEEDDQIPDMAWASTLYSLDEGKIVYAGDKDTRPLLWLQTCTFPSVNGSCDRRTVIYDYDQKHDKFVSVFGGETGSNNNQDTRFMADGPLRGDVIADRPTQDAPYGYWVDVYGRKGPGSYSQLVEYRSHTRYGDGNPLPVIDSEMPVILQHLGLWKPGDPLPIPVLPADSNIGNCDHPVLKHGEEWCH